MHSSNNIIPKPENDAPKLYKEIWVDRILPYLDNKTLITFSAASKETRQLAFTELCKRREFIEHLDRKITMIEIFCRDESTYSDKLFEAFQIAVTGSFIFGILSLMIHDTWQNSHNDDYEQFTARAIILTLMILVILSPLLYAYPSHVTRQESRQIDQFKKRKREKVKRLKYLRDELPKITVTTHSLFRMFVDTSNNRDQKTLHCAIL